MYYPSSKDPNHPHRQRQSPSDQHDVSPAPGRVTRTGALPTQSAQLPGPVQRKAAEAASAAVRPTHEWMRDADMLAAHGFAPPQQTPPQQTSRQSGAVQTKPVQQQDQQDAQQPAKPPSGFRDLDAAMFRVTLAGSERIVEAIARQTNGDGNVFYVATGRVTGFSGERPVVENYDEPKHLGEWQPRVTHVNGMMVTPEEGIGSAETLHASIAAQLDDAAMTPDVLYTYSAKGGFFPDLIDSAKSKLGIEDKVTQSQTTLILDAVRSGQRISVSAHSRGTIKTEVAVRNVHAILREELLADLTSSPAAEAAAQEAEKMARDLAAAGHPTIQPALAGQIARRAAAKKLAGERAWDAIEEHVQLIYAGNAVKFPSPPAELVVGRADFVSMTVGTYFKLGRDIKRFQKIAGGHSFTTNYAATVGEWIADDLSQ